MQNLDFKSWMEAGAEVPFPSFKPTNKANPDRIKDQRMMHNGPFTGFKDPPKILRRFGSDLMTGMHRYAQHIKGDLTSQDPNHTYDIGHELKYNVENRGKSIIINVPCSTKIFFNTDEEGNLLDKRNEITTEIDKAEYCPDKELKKKTLDFFEEFYKENEKLQDDTKHADLHTVKYMGYEPLHRKDENGNEMVDLIFSASPKDSEFESANPNYTPRRI